MHVSRLHNRIIMKMESAQQLPAPCSLAVAASGRRVTINNGSQSQVSKGGSSGCVFITPLSGNMPNPSQQLIRPTFMLQNSSPPLAKVLVKAVSKDGPKDSGKMFTLRDLDTTSILSCKDLKQAIRRQLSDDIIILKITLMLGIMESSSVVPSIKWLVFFLFVCFASASKMQLTR